MHIKFYREQKLAARERLGWKLNDTECELTEDEHNDWMTAHGKVMPCKNQRRWDKFVSWFWSVVILIVIFSGFMYLSSFTSPLNGFVIMLILWWAIWSYGRRP